MNAGEQLDQRRLAGAVLADDGVNLALVESQIHGFERVGRAEALVELVQGEKRRAMRRSGAVTRRHCIVAC